MATAKLAQRMWWVGVFGWTLLASAAAYWAAADVVVTAGGTPVMVLLALLLGGAFLAGLAHAWFGWFSLITDRILRGDGRAGPRFLPMLAIAGVALSPAALVLVLRSVGDQTPPTVLGLAWLAVLILLGGSLAGLRSWTRGYGLRSN